MTQQEFLIVASNLPNSVNVWYTTTVPYIAQGVTVPTKGKSGDITRYLQQVETITVEVNEGQFLPLEITGRVLLGTAPNQYYFFNIKPVTIVDVGDTSVPIGTIYLSPGIQGSDYTNSPYNILQGTAEIARQSDYIMQSDRASGTLKIVGGGLPTNIDNLQSGSATKAYIQDSLYSDTGWTRARYDGTPTTRLTYGGIDPAIQGNVFKGSYFTSASSDSRIFSQSEADIPYIDYLFTGIQEVPQYTTQYTKHELAVNINSTTQTIEVTIPTNNTMDIQIGDLLKFSNSTTVVSRPEIIKVQSIEIISRLRLQLTVSRGWNLTPTSEHTTINGRYLHKITPVQIFKLFGNKIQPESRGKIKVQQTGDLMYIDSLGYIVTGSLN